MHRQFVAQFGQMHFVFNDFVVVFFDGDFQLFDLAGGAFLLVLQIGQRAVDALFFGKKAVDGFVDAGKIDHLFEVLVH